MKIAILAVLLALTSGCVHTAAIVHELAQDTNSVRLVVSTIYGTITLERNIPYKVSQTP